MPMFARHYSRVTIVLAIATACFAFLMLVPGVQASGSSFSVQGADGLYHSLNSNGNNFLQGPIINAEVNLDFGTQDQITIQSVTISANNQVISDIENIGVQNPYYFTIDAQKISNGYQQLSIVVNYILDGNSQFYYFYYNTYFLTGPYNLTAYFILQGSSPANVTISDNAIIYGSGNLLIYATGLDGSAMPLQSYNILLNNQTVASQTANSGTFVTSPISIPFDVSSYTDGTYNLTTAVTLANGVQLTLIHRIVVQNHDPLLMELGVATIGVLAVIWIVQRHLSRKNSLVAAVQAAQGKGRVGKLVSPQTTKSEIKTSSTTGTTKQSISRPAPGW